MSFRNHRTRLLSLAALLFGLLAAGSAQAVLEIRITQGVEGAIPIAVVPFGAQGGAVATDVAGVVSADLARSGRFSVTDRARYPEQPAMGGNVNFKAWRGQGVDHVVVGRLVTEGSGVYRVQFQLFDTLQQRQLMGYSIPARSDQLRQAAHQISDYIYEKLTGEPGAFNTRIAYVTTEVESGDKRNYVLQVADSDGFNPRTVLRSQRPLMSPTWSPDGTRLAYVAFDGGRSGIYVQNLATAKQERVAQFPGINGAPAWSPDGSKLALTLSKGGNPDLYVLDLRSKALKQLTRDRAIDTEPVWMPDGRSLVFTSDRSGAPQIYRVSASGGRAERLTFDGSYNADADISPDGTRLVMVNGDGGRFRIAMLDLETGLFRVLTRGRLDEAPSFAPNGAMVLYATEQNGRGILAAVSSDGRVHQSLVLQEGEVREPDWSPFMK